MCRGASAARAGAASGPGTVAASSSAGAVSAVRAARWVGASTRERYRRTSLVAHASHQPQPSRARRVVGAPSPRRYDGAVTLRLHDTATRAIRDFVPLREGQVGIYLCGLTVQSEPHVGHVRSAVNFDVLRRWLLARGYDVTFIRNITDIDDKILIKSAEQGRPWYNLAYDMTARARRGVRRAQRAPPTYEPLATGHVPEMLELIDRLIASGHAYAAEDGSGDVYFDVRSWPSYGELTRPADRRDGGRRGRRPARQARPAGLRAVEGLEEGVRARDRGLALAVGAGASRLAHRVLGDGAEVPRRRLRHPRRRRRPALPAPRERAGAVARGRLRVRVDVDAQRVDHHRRREDEQVARQQPHDARRCSSGCARSTCGSTSSPRTTARTWSSPSRRSRRPRPASRASSTSWSRAASVLGEVDARRRRAPTSRTRWTTTSATPAAVAAIYDVVREGNKLLADGDRPTRCAARPARCARCSRCSGSTRSTRTGPRGGSSDDEAQADGGRRRAGRGAARAAGGGACRQGLRDRRRDPRPDQGGRHRGRGHPVRARRGPCDRRPRARTRAAGCSRASRANHDREDWADGRQLLAPRRDQEDRQGQPDRRLRRPGAARARGPRADPEGQGPRGPQGLQGSASAPRRPPAPRRCVRASPAPTPSGSPGATPSSRRCGRTCR